jgi:hypothetical protein
MTSSPHWSSSSGSWAAKDGLDSRSGEMSSTSVCPDRRTPTPRPTPRRWSSSPSPPAAPPAPQLRSDRASRPAAARRPAWVQHPSPGARRSRPSTPPTCPSLWLAQSAPGSPQPSARLRAPGSGRGRASGPAVAAITRSSAKADNAPILSPAADSTTDRRRLRRASGRSSAALPFGVLRVRAMVATQRSGEPIRGELLTAAFAR